MNKSDSDDQKKVASFFPTKNRDDTAIGRDPTFFSEQSPA